MAYDRLVLVTRQTDLEALVERFQTVSQAQFYLTQAGHDFETIRQRHETYLAALKALRLGIPAELKTHLIERRTLPQYRFDAKDVVVTLGQDGLVANVAKYLDGQPLIAVNPDPKHIDGILLPVIVRGFQQVLGRTLTQAAELKVVTMAEAQLSDGQRLKAVNDIFIGARSHVSVRYQIRHGKKQEEQSSSGVIVSTGVGSTGWLRSVYAGAVGIVQAINPGIDVKAPEAMPWDTDHLVFNVREPWPSLNTTAGLVAGTIAQKRPLELVSRMPEGGVIFGDGMEMDYLEFNAGVTAKVGISGVGLNMVMR